MNDENTEIRSARPTDAPGIARLLVELGSPVELERVAQRLEDMASQGAIAIVAVRGEDVLGVISAQRNSLLHRTADDVRIHTLVVSEHAQNLGIGRRLVAHVEDWAAEMGCARIDVSSANAMTDAHEFYKHLGFQQTSLRFTKGVDE